VWSGPHQVSAVLRAVGHGLLVAMEKGLARLDPNRGTLELLYPLPVPDGWRLNDAFVDPAGRVLAGSMSPRARDGQLFLCVPDRAPRSILSGIRISNGMALCRGDAVLLHTDSPARTILAYPYDPEGLGLGPPQPWYSGAEEDGVPDGCAQDAEGCLWTACWDGRQVLRLDPEGRIRQRLHMPAAKMTTCVFAGPDLDWLYLASAGVGKEAEPAGRTWRLRLPDVRGKLSHRAAW
jgi:sugar lactone lactonase YvrE